MSTVTEIKNAIEALTPEERAEVERMLREPPKPAASPQKLPDQASRRRRIFGDKVLPNLVLEARESESA
ncbi:MAG: hypothetical protein HZA91_20535 [Verrucomicrobia bacterium]|nr:hypothetical protein [Verrucomicrobiota bacterium]